MRRLLAGILMCGAVAADAVVVTKAMTASTIAEIYVTENSVRVELEIGVTDLKAFHNLLPDQLRKRLGLDPTPLKERLPRFFADDWVVKADGNPLPAKIEQLRVRPRVERDEITGVPLRETEEIVLFVELRYPLGARHRTLTLKSLGSTGFVVYHLGLAVNDFRYLAGEQTLELDWEDPWYSSFQNRGYRRRYYSPIQAFLYIDAFEVRKEIIVRPKDLQQWVDLGLEGQKIIRADQYDEIKRRVAAFLADRNPVTIDGKAVRMKLDRIHFVRRTLRRTGVIDPPTPISRTGIRSRGSHTCSTTSCTAWLPAATT